MEYELTHVKGLIKAVQDMVSNCARLKNRLEYYQMCKNYQEREITRECERETRSVT